MINKETVEEIQKIIGDKYPIINVYVVGSQVYETSNAMSDIDLKVIVNNADFKKTKHLGMGMDMIYDITLYNYNHFIDCIQQNKIDVLEAVMVGDIYKSEIMRFKFGIKPHLLRKSISSINSNSWVKCKKKLAQDDYEIGIKSLFHSLRVIDFGIQIMTYGIIVKYNSANGIWKRLTNGRNVKWTWDELIEEFKSTKNKMMSEFRILAPKK